MKKVFDKIRISIPMTMLERPTPCEKKRRSLPGLLAVLFLALCLAGPLVTACENASSDNTALVLAMMVAAQQQKQQQQQQQAQAAQQAAATAATNAPAARTITVRGSVAGSYGALPAGAAALVQPQLFDAAAISHSASPDLSAAGYEWFAMAQSGGVTVEGTFVAGSADRAFEIPLEVGKTWNIICGIRVAGGGAHVMADSYPFTATEEDAVLTRAFIPEPVSEGSGSVVLKVALDSSLTGTLAVSKATAFCAADDWPVYDAATGSKEWPLAIEGSTATLTIPEAKRGTYDVAFSFFATGDVFLYTTVQTVNVLANAQTDTWALGGGEGRVEDGKLVVDKNLVTKTSQTVLYVGTTGAPNAKAPSDANAGGAYAPLAHVAKAVQIIEATATSGSGKAYKIFVCGTVSSASASDNANFSSALDGKAASITISGLNASAAIDAGATGSALTVETKVPVAIKNVKITGGSAEKGGGIFVKGSGVKVTLEGGAKVEGNAATVGGGGAYIEGGAELCVDGGSLLSNTAASGGGVFVAADGSKLLVKGSSSLPYGGQTGDNPPVNDVYLEKSGTGSYSAVEVADGFAPDVSQGKIAISAQGWNRKQVIVKAAAGSGVTDISNCENYFESTAGDVNFSFGGIDKSVAKLTAPYYVSASNGHDTGDTPGTESSPYKTLAFACEQMSGGDKETIYVKNSIGKDSIPASFYGGEKFDTDKCSSLTIIGATALPASGIPQDKIDAGGSGTALTVYADPVKPVPVTIKNLKITGGNNTNGGGLVVSSGATVTLGEGACVAGNKASYGGGVYVAGDLLIDGGVVGDKNATDHAKYEGDSYSNYAGERGGGVCFDTTGKVTLKSGFVAYNYSKKRGGGIATSFDDPSDNSQLDLKGGEVSYNCAGPHDDFEVGGGLFLKGCKFYFTSGKVHHNYAVAGGGGICLQKTVGAAIMSGGSVYDNEYRNTTPGTTVDHKWGSDLLLFNEATLDMSGGKIDSPSHSQKDYGVMIKTSSCALNISGNAEISKETPLLPGDIIYDEGHDTYTYNDNPITIAGALTPPDPADLSKKNVYIVPTKWQRGLQVLKTPDTITDETAKKALIDNNYSRFGTVDDDFEVKAKGTSGIINAPLCVAAPNGTRKSPVNEGALGQKVWGPPNATDTARGTRSQPFAKMSQAVAQMTDKTAPYEILINGTIKGDVFACAEFDGAKVGDVTIRGVNGDNSNDVLDADKLGATTGSSGGSSLPNYPVLKFTGTDETHKMSVTIQDIKICGGNNTPEAGPRGGGISASCADVSLAKGALIAQNKAYRGGGVGFRKGNLFIYADACVGAKGGGTATGSSITDDECSNCATDWGGGIYCEYGGVYLGYKNASTVATNDDAWTGGVYRNWADSAGGIFLLNEAKCYMAAGTVSQNQCAGAGGGISISSLANSFSMTGGKIESNEATEGGAVYNEKDFVMSGTAYIPYGGGAGKNDVCLAENKRVTIDGSIALPTGKSGANATITPRTWKRGTVIAQGKDGGTLSDDVKNWLALADASGDGWQLELSSDKKSATIDAPIYVAAGAAYDATTNPGGYRACGSKGLDSNIGTKSAPYATVTKALTQLKNSSKHYTIYIDGTVSENLMISSRSGASPNVTGANSITLMGAATTLATPISITEATADCLNGGGTGRVITMQGPVPVITNSLKISGGKCGDEGGGIYIAHDADLTLDNNTFVTGNSVYYDGGLSLIGGGISVNGALKIKGTVKVHDNKKLDGSDNVIGDSNVYLPSDKVMKVSGALTGSEIHVTTGVKPSIDFTTSPATVKPVIITNDYYVHNSTDPSEFFKSDEGYGALFDSYYGEAVFGVHGGGISVEDIYKNVELSVNKTWVTKAKLADGSARFIVSGTIDGQAVNFITPTNDYYASISLKLLYHGEEIPQTSSYYSVTNCYLYLYSGLPAGDYVLAATCVYKEKTYSASFDIKVIGDSAPGGYVMTGGETVTGAVGTAAPSSVFITGRTVDIPVIIACDHEVTQAEYEKYCCYGDLKPTDTYGMGDDYPVYNVSWYDALVYCNLRSIAEGLTPVYSIGGKTDPKQWSGIVVGTGDDIGKYRGTESGSYTNAWNAVAFDQNANGWRLPTEAEWEYLARAANKQDYLFSGSDDETNFVWYNGNADNKAKPVKTRHDSSVDPKNELGLYDMSGNVYEWCWDWKGTINSSTPATGSTSLSKVIRGGSACDELTYCSVSSRYYAQSPRSPNYDIGFRVVRNAR